MDAFFVSVELLDHPELRGKPVAVGGQERGVVSAASYEARAYGVNSAMPVGIAKRKCPGLIMIPGHHRRYSEVSGRIMEILRSVTPLVEQVSVDEAFLDVGGSRKIFGSPTEIGRLLRERIRAEEGVPASVGIAATKSVAKVASAHAKPDGLLLIPKDATLDFMHSLPVGALWGVGEKTRERLEQRGIYTVADVAAIGQDRMIGLLGEGSGRHLYALAMGHDPRPVRTEHEEKSVSKEQTFFDFVHDRDALERTLLDQAHDIARRLRRHGVVAKTVGIKVRFGDFSTITRSVTLGAPTATAAELHRFGCLLFREVTIPPSGIRLIGLKADQLSDPGLGIQLSIDDDGRTSVAEETMDSIRAKFGPGALGPGSLLNERHRRSE